MTKTITVQVDESLPGWALRPEPGQPVFTPHERLVVFVIWGEADISNIATLSMPDLLSLTGLTAAQLIKAIRSLSRAGVLTQTFCESDVIPGEPAVFEWSLCRPEKRPLPPTADRMGIEL